MPRRASSSTQPLKVLAIVVLLAGAIAAGYFVYSTISDPYRTLAPLDMPAYLQNSNSLRGNSYKLVGTIADQLAWSRGSGKLISVEVDSGNGGDVVAVLVPSQLSHINIQKGQRFFFRIEIGDQGIIRAHELKKV